MLNIAFLEAIQVICIPTVRPSWIHSCSGQDNPIHQVSIETNYQDNLPTKTTKLIIPHRADSYFPTNRQFPSELQKPREYKNPELMSEQPAGVFLVLMSTSDRELLLVMSLSLVLLLQKRNLKKLNQIHFSLQESKLYFKKSPNTE